MGRSSDKCSTEEIDIVRVGNESPGVLCVHVSVLKILIGLTSLEGGWGHRE